MKDQKSPRIAGLIYDDQPARVETRCLYEAVGSARKTIKIFSPEEGGAEHAHVDNRQVGIDFAADWLMANLSGTIG
jgi:hypothetical protein